MESRKKIILNDSDRKSLIRIFFELMWLRIHSKSFNDVRKAYLDCLIFKKDAGRVQDYLPYDKWSLLKKNHFHNDDGSPILCNKISFSSFMAKHEMPIPQYLGKINKEYFESSDTNIPLKNQQDLLECLRTIIEQNGPIFVKRNNSNQAKHVYRIDLNNLKAEIHNINPSEEYVIEKVVVQHKDLDAINPYCLNTIRVITYRQGDKVLHPQCILKLGVKGIHADNGMVGGMFVRYDINQNKLASKAYKNIKHGASSYSKHPDTGFVFKDATLPYPDQIKELTRKAALLFDKEWIGWDIGYTPDGPIIIEGNRGPSIPFMQIASKGLFADPIYKNVFNYLK